jgi:hypothetical protein
MPMTNRLLVALFAGAAIAAPCLAQDSGKPAQPAAHDHAHDHDHDHGAESPKPVWTEPEFEAIGAVLVGSWRSQDPVLAGGEGVSARVVMHVAPVFIADLPNALYCEVAREDGLRQPYRQTVWSFQRVGGKVRLTTFEFRTEGGLLRSANATWAHPEVFPPVTREANLIATLAFDVQGSGGSYSGRTPHPYPTGAGGAVEMTSEFTADGKQFTTADRGFGADGKMVWGPASGQATRFERFESGVKTVMLEPGLVRVNFPPEGPLGEPAKEGERITCHYSGYLQNGKVFDASYERGQPFVYTLGQPLIQGWIKLMDPMRAGDRCRLFIPAHLAYGERGRRGSIPPNSPLIFDLDILAVEPPPPATPPEEPIKPQPVTEPSGEKPAEQPK